MKDVQFFYKLGRYDVNDTFLNLMASYLYLGLHGNSTEGFFLKNLYCLECTHNVEYLRVTWKIHIRPYVS